MTRRCAMRWPRCRGLRVLRQDPWECLASFILSSTKQIVQIRQIVALLCERFGEPIPDRQPPGNAGVSPARSITISQFVRRRDASAPRTPSPRPAGRGTGEGASYSKENHLFHSFPTAERLANVTEAQLRACKMGFRAPHLLAAARQIADGKLDLERLRHLPLAEARGN